MDRSTVIGGIAGACWLSLIITAAVIGHRLDEQTAKQAKAAAPAETYNQVGTWEDDKGSITPAHIHTVHFTDTLTGKKYLVFVRGDTASAIEIKP